MPTENAAEHRLPTDVVPSHYDLTVWTDLENLRFEGIVHATLLVKKETSSIVLNTTKLEIGDVYISTLTDSGLGDRQVAQSRSFDDKLERGIFTFASPFPQGSRVRMTLTFKDDLSGDMLGYYLSRGGADGKTVYALTQFQPTAARRSFPCWDEPLLKATVSATLVSRVGTVNLNNMPAVSEARFPEANITEPWIEKKLKSLADPDEWKVTKFETTPPISTYIIAYANGPFDHLESSYTSPLTGNTRPLRFYATSDNIGQAQFGLDITRTVVPLYEQMFGIEYPLPKLDTLVASDFDMGAMENWGLITGRTSGYLRDPNSSDVRSKVRVAGMQSHEIAHMWFGNITTMEWWDNLYLNEGFATFGLPGVEARLCLLDEQLLPSRELDAKLSSHPVEVDCPDANMINQIFDRLSYAKAASILRMLCKHVGEDLFIKGVSIYLKKHMYANSVTRDLWEGIQESTNIDIPKMMDNWVKKMGYPVITVTEENGGIRVRQDRFLETGPASPEHNDTIWTVPLNLLTVSGNNEVEIERMLLEGREKYIALDTSKAFKLNADMTGFYVTAYSEGRLTKLGEQMASKASPFSLSDKIGVVCDALALAKAGYSSLGGSLSVIVGLRNEKEYLIWNAVSLSLSEIVSTWWEHPKIVEKLDALRLELFVPIVRELGFDGSDEDSYDVRQLRTIAIEQAAAAGDPSVTAELKKRFAHFLETGDDSQISSDLLAVTFATAVKEGGQAEWDVVRNICGKARTPAHGTAAMRALGATQDMARATATFEYLMTEARNQDVIYYVWGLLINRRTRRFQAESFKAHYPEASQICFEKRFAGNFQTFIGLFEAVFDGLSSERDYEETAAFFKDKDTAKFDMSLNQTLDAIRSRGAWVERSTKELEAWLERQ
ncbi:leucyl aminopeptidase [Epithele typhae]|uniref:leucyl aminopeptidase n=1 Tax=Epithele typhae TaxID=378194 RepID=UPI0020083F55|nr:leucyl aminopeptidase [Epithele typhae]KAH9923984.1 leucyl aminopeptidase [Epithele typhae]